jgi:hypothetical protein
MKLAQFVPLVVLGCAFVVSDARAEFMVPATAGIPGSNDTVNSDDIAHPLWFWGSDVTINRASNPNIPDAATQPTHDALEWMIPLVFYGVAGHRQKWGVRVMVSGGVDCNIRWWPYDDLETGPIGTGTAHSTHSGSLLLTSDALCLPISGSPTEGCVTSLGTAQVSCSVPEGGWVGQVNYWLRDLDEPHD